MKRMVRKLLSLLMALVILCTAAPQAAWAVEDEDNEPGGSGEVNGDGSGSSGAFGEVAVTEVILNVYAYTLDPGLTLQLQARVNPVNAAYKSVAWETTDERIATVNQTGLVTAVAQGTATITATIGGKSASCVVTVREVNPVYTVEIAGGTEISNQSPIILTATAWKTVGTVVTNVTSQGAWEWRSSDPGVATVANNGVVTPTGNGEAAVTAAFTATDGTKKSASHIVRVRNMNPVYTVEITGSGEIANQSPIVLAATAWKTVGMAVTNVTNQGTWAWNSSNPEVATVAGNGVVTPTGNGEATVTATFTAAGGIQKSASHIVRVRNMDPVYTVEITGSTEIANQNPITLTATAIKTVGTVATNVTNQGTWTWGSSNPDVATVANGVVTPTGNGEAVITAAFTAADGAQQTASHRVTVRNMDPVYTVEITGSTEIANQSPITLAATAIKTVGTKVTNVTSQGAWTWGSSKPGVATVANGVVTPTGNGETTITATFTAADGAKKAASYTVEVKNLLTVSTSSSAVSVDGMTTITSMDGVIYLTASVAGHDGVEVSWGVASTADSAYFTVSNSRDGYIVMPAGPAPERKQLDVNAMARVGAVTYITSVTITLDLSVEISLAATVSANHYLGEEDGKNSDSVTDQLARAITAQGRNYILDYLTFENVTSDFGELDADRGARYCGEDLEGIEFIPREKGVAVFSFTAYVDVGDKNGRDGVYPGILSITVTDTQSNAPSGGISYVAGAGEDVPLLAEDFEDFWYEAFRGGTLDYVDFGPFSGGTLYCEDGVRVGSKYCYVNPARSSQIDLNTVYFSPASTKAATVKLPFTAYGEVKDREPKSVSGAVVIAYLPSSGKTIEYTVNANGTASPVASDFTAAYQAATGKNAPSSLTVVFLDVPEHGELTYTDSSRNNSKTVALTENNIGSRGFTTKASGSNQIGDLTYAGAGGRDTLRYVAYNGDTPMMIGTVAFNGQSPTPTDLTVTFLCTGSGGVNFIPGSFTASNPAAMGACASVRFEKPTQGSLVFAGTTVSAVGMGVPLASLGSVAYQPAPGVTGGTDSLNFTAYNASGAVLASGKVTVNISIQAAATISVDNFIDVPKTAATEWYRPQLADLVSKGIIAGQTANTFNPNGNVTNGAALKMVLLAAGYPAQAEIAGNDWAINYKNLAVSAGLISGTVVLSSDISRDAVAELVAKALGLAPVTDGTSPYVDDGNPYVLALYHAGIMQGTVTSSGRYFYGGRAIQRAEMCVVIYNINRYYTGRP